MAGRWRAEGRFVNVMLDEQARARGGAVSGDQRPTSERQCVHGSSKESAPHTFLQMMLCFQRGETSSSRTAAPPPARPPRATAAVKWSFSSVLRGATGASATFRAVAMMGFSFSLLSLFSRHFHPSNAVICSGRTMASSDRSSEDKETD